MNGLPITEFEKGYHMGRSDALKTAPETAAERDRLKASNAELVEALLVANACLERANGAGLLIERNRALLARTTHEKN